MLERFANHEENVIEVTYRRQSRTCVLVEIFGTLSGTAGAHGSQQGERKDRDTDERDRGDRENRRRGQEKKRREAGARNGRRKV